MPQFGCGSAALCNTATMMLKTKIAILGVVVLFSTAAFRQYATVAAFRSRLSRLPQSSAFPSTTGSGSI